MLLCACGLRRSCILASSHSPICVLTLSPIAALRSLRSSRLRCRLSRRLSRHLCCGDRAQDLHSPVQALPAGYRGLRAAQGGLQQAHQAARNVLQKAKG